MGEFDDKIEELDGEIKRLQKEKLDLEILDIIRKNAAMLHEKFCTKNHPDECEWSSEIKDEVIDWEGPVHKDWFQKSEMLFRAGYRIPDVIKIKDMLGLKMEDK